MEALSEFADLTNCLFHNQEPTCTQNMINHNIIAAKSQQLHALRQQFYFLHAAMSSPIRRLSTGLLARIMELTISQTNRSLQDILTLAQVCRLWRETALKTPSLWTHFNVTWDQACHPDVLEFADPWIADAQRRPACLTIRESVNYPCLSLCPLLVFALTHLRSRLLEIDITCPYSCLAMFATSPCFGPFTVLRKARIHAKGAYDAEYLAFLYKTISRALPVVDLPQLQSLRISGVENFLPYGTPLTEVVLSPWSQLQTLELNDVVDTHDWDAIFLQCTQLVHARISSSAPTEDPDPDLDDLPIRINFPHLRTLDLAFECYPSKVLDFASFPSLRTLELRIRNREFLFGWSHEWQPFDHWVSLHNVVQTTRRLSALVLEGFSFHTRDDELHHLLAQLPFLTYLAFQYCDFSSIRTLHALSAPSFLPVLEDLRFSEVSMRREDHAFDVRNPLDPGVYYATCCAIEKFLRARATSPNCRLRFFKFTFVDYDEEMEEDCKVILQALESWQTTCMITKGLEVCIDGIPEWEDSDDEREREEAGVDAQPVDSCALLTIVSSQSEDCLDEVVGIMLGTELTCL
ncbi:hypothetical protein GGG16DRAFT_106255 [Schizophyllum commune]